MECTEFGLVGGLIKALTTGIDEVVYTVSNAKLF